MEDSDMAWFLNHYHCDDCGTDWQDEWSCGCDDDCPECGSRHWSPMRSDDLTFVIEPEDGRFAVHESPVDADDEPSYARVAVAPTAESATAYITSRQAAYWDHPPALAV